MLLNRKQEWELYPEIKQPAAPKATQPQINFKLRSKCFALVISLAIMAMLVTIQSEAIVHSGYELVQIKTQAFKVERDNEQLRLDIAKLRSPQRIQKIAEKELGMVMPQYIYQANKQSVLPDNKANNSAAGKVVGMAQVSEEVDNAR